MVERCQRYYLYEEWENEYYEKYGLTLSDLKILATEGLATDEQLRLIDKCENQGKGIVTYW